ncbi:MAG TPA: UvrD-helicase domain-containing protein [Gaiella sp.]|nr:UvrD-helicase domain-containing protein [Gaiella sp.]
MAHPDLPAEQAYVDHAYDCLDRMRAVVERAADATDSEVAALALEAWAVRRLKTFEDAERGLCFGRLDLDTTPVPLYVGRRWVHDDDNELLVVNWQAPAARPFYVATPADPHNVTLRRRFRTEGRRLLDLSDETLDGSGSIAGGDFLLDELERSREPHMRDIVATIQSDQYRLITRDPEPPLVVQGGPGTGKTAVGLHRASYLLYSHRDRLRRVLVVGPNPTFMEYVSHVLPTLGEENVEQRAVGELVDGVEVSVTDPPAVERLKGDGRLAAVIANAAAARAAAHPEELVARMEGEYLRVREREVAELLAEARRELGLTTRARERFRMNVLRRFYEDYGARLGGLAWRDFGEVERALNAKGFLGRWLDRVWPAVSPDALVRTLLTSRPALEAAAAGILDDAEQRSLRRSRAGFGWSEHDVPLVDEARAVLAEPARTFGHVIVDEAQDLTPMQLRMVARRAARASVTILGDIAQATGPVVHDGWNDVLRHLPGEPEIEELRHAYRVPAEIMELALPLLDRIAPGVEAPLAFRTGATAPHVERVPESELLTTALYRALGLAREEGLLAVILPEQLVPDLTAHSAYDDGIPLLSPRRAKGLEFDHVVVVEPALIAEGETGLRELYVALTRPTRTLVVVHSRPLPEPLGAAVP